MTIQPIDGSQQILDNQEALSKQAEKLQEQRADILNAEALQKTNGALLAGRADSISPSDIENISTSISISYGSDFDKPVLRASFSYTAQFKELGLDQEEGKNLIALMALIFIEMVEASSSFWQTTWQQGSAQMEFSFKMGPLIADAIMKKGISDSDQTKAQANQAMIEGIVNAVAFAVSATAGIVSAAKAASAAKETAGKATDQAAKESLKKGLEKSDEAASMARLEGTAAQSTTPAATQVERQAVEQSAGEAANAARVQMQKKIAEKAGVAAAGISGSMEVVMTMNMFQTAVSKITESHTLSYVADKQLESANWEAVRSQLQTFVQVNDQGFGRTEGIKDGAKHFIDETISSLLQVVQAIVEAINSGARI